MSNESLDHIADVARWTAANSRLFNNPDESPIHTDVADGANTLVVVTGENASGKSLYVRAIAAMLNHNEGVLPITVSIRERTGAGSGESSALRKVFMFGDEQEQSTGATSVSTVERAFGNLDRDKGSILVLDEPEMGLAESYTRALGEFIGQQAKTIPAVCRGVVVVSHSRPLVQGLIAGFGDLPTHVAVTADEPAQAGIESWLQTVEHRTVEQLLGLRDVGLTRWRTLNKLLVK